MGTADDLAEALAHLLIGDVDPVGAHEGAHLGVALVAVVHDPVEHLLQGGRGDVDIIAEDVDRAAVFGADLNAGDDLKTGLFRLGRRADIAAGRIVVCDRDRRKAEPRRLAHDLLGRGGAVGGGGVDVKVDSFHLTA